MECIPDLLIDLYHVHRRMGCTFDSHTQYISLNLTESVNLSHSDAPDNSRMLMLVLTLITILQVFIQQWRPKTERHGAPSTKQRPNTSRLN